MPLRPMMPVILLASVVSIMVAVLAAGRGSGWTLALAVALFAIQMLFVALRLNATFWGSKPPATEAPASVACAQSNAVLAALVYAWGAIAMLAIYSLTPLKWQHWWQYGAAMLLIAGAIFLYAYVLTAGRESYRSTRALEVLTGLTAAQGIAVVVAFLWLVLSGKIYTPRGDWAANEIFIGGAVMLAMLSAVSVLTLRKLTRRQTPA
jgi:uncharacterized membrane protein